MLLMIAKMSVVTLISVLLTYILWKKTKDEKLSVGLKIVIGIIYGVYSIASTHFGVDYGSMMLNVRDLGPMSAGLFFDPVSGIIAGLIGGIERYIAGTYFGVAPFTRIACSVSTCLAGFLSAFLSIVVLNRKKPSVTFAFFMGSVIEVFHMYVVFATHRDNMSMAFLVVKTCAGPMIIFSGLGLALSSALIRKSSGELFDMLRTGKKGDTTLSHKIQVWLFGVTAVVLAINFFFAFYLQTTAAVQAAKDEILQAQTDIEQTYYTIKQRKGDVSRLVTHVGDNGMYFIIDINGDVVSGASLDPKEVSTFSSIIKKQREKEFFKLSFRADRWLCMTETLYDGSHLFIAIPESGMFAARDIQAYEIFLADIMVFTVIYILISLLVQRIIVDKLLEVNKSLAKITDGDLDEQVSVYSSSEFASLSDDINMTVSVLKGYIEAAEKRMEQELLLARTIQESALPTNFDYNISSFDVFASMDPAKEVGGDFYDIFFVDVNKLALVIADVSGKGIPAALFMMRSKSALRSMAETGKDLVETFTRVNNELCSGNEADMFVTVWMGIMDLNSGKVNCINAGHEYPVIMRKGVGYDLFKEKHSAPMGVMEGMSFFEYEIDLEPGDGLFVYTDGVPEAINKDEEQYGTERMLHALNENKTSSMEKLLQEIREDVKDFVGEAEQFDDVTMLGFKYNGM